jgi:carboxylesterase type B
VFIHGGYWRAFDKSDFSFVATPFVAAGLAVAVVNYDLCPSVPIATIADEVRRAARWIVREGAAHGAHPDRIVVGGHSAGGHLTRDAVRDRLVGLRLRRATVCGRRFAIGCARSRADGAIRAVRRRSEARRRRGGAALTGAARAAHARPARARGRRRRVVRVHPPDAAPVGRVAAEQARRGGGADAHPARNHFNVVVDLADPSSELTSRGAGAF